jgi:glycosyltransferase involved in cell wall biosynthesis
MGLDAKSVVKMTRQRPLVAFFDYPDVFEDFYPHYGVDQHAFATRWSATGNHAFISLLQREVGDVVWYCLSLQPALSEARHQAVGCRIKFIRSGWWHRCLWRLFYNPRIAWRWRSAYRAYATLASYLALLSWPLFRALRADRPDCFFIQSYSSGRFDMLLLAARLLGVPLIAYHAGGRPESYLGRIVRRWTLPHADCLIASGQGELEMLINRFGVPRNRVQVILTPIDTDVFRPLDRWQSCVTAGLDPERRHLLFVGRLDDSVKRISSLIRRFSRLSGDYPDADLLIAGEGRDEEKLRRLAAEQAPGRVRFLGWVSETEQKVLLYNAAECVLLPSVREGFPTVVAEAMACAAPALVTSNSSAGELVIDGETGWLLPPGDDEALEYHLRWVLDHPRAIAAMRPRARKRAESRVCRAVVAAQLRRCFSVGGSHG